jgi:DnaJ-class molecular chaperone
MANGGTIDVKVRVTGYWQACPVCGGRGFVPAGFYSFGGHLHATNAERCRTCRGETMVRCPVAPGADASDEERRLTDG